jgi:hypothetical protein
MQVGIFRAVRVVNLLTFCLMLSLVGCASTRPLPPQPERIPLQAPLQKAGFHQPLLNVAILVFDAGNLQEQSRVSTPLRNAEVLYVPVLLKRTLEESGGWGAVRVLPDEDPSAELQISGSIIASDGIGMSLAITVQDATGRVWLDRTYTDYAFDHGYQSALNYLVDPFQDLYNQIVNDINEVRVSLDKKTLERVLDTAMLRYAQALSPEGFSSFLSRDAQGELTLVGLPARDDSMYQRARRIRESEYGFTDTVDEAYTRFYNEIGQTYTYWRSYSYELVLGNETLERENAEGKQRPRSWAVLEHVYNTYRESRLNEDALRQMTDSFDDEVTPTVTSLEGAVIHLEGSLQAKYQQWRNLLRDIYAKERALPR